jgi:hypothetical protein
MDAIARSDHEQGWSRKRLKFDGLFARVFKAASAGRNSGLKLLSPGHPMALGHVM